ncbi:hypothetical protein COB64_00465 [Candidatus Wolfebacteria bacterium]|nr:MAG: hypothetical protein COB64_00465 [Candidatus Wolfebacteria bacterium]
MVNKNIPTTKKSSKRLLRKRKRVFLHRFGAILIIVIPIIVISFLGIQLYQASAYNAFYTTDLNPETFKNDSLPLYINEDLNKEIFGQGGVIDNEYYFEIIGSPFEFIWQPEEFPIKKDVQVSATFKGNTFLELGIPCIACNQENYRWEPFYDPLKNPPAITTLFEKNTENNYTKNSITEIKNELVGSQVFYVYLEDKIDLSITKISLNPHSAEKNILVTLTNLEGTIVWEEELPHVTHEETSFRFEAALEEKGIYKLSIVNSLDDFIITNLSINTHAIASADTIHSKITIDTSIDEWITISKQIEGEFKDKNAINFVLRNQILEEKKKKEDIIRERGFTIAQEFKDFLIWKKDNAPVLHFVVPDEESTLREFLALSIPEKRVVEENKDLGIVRDAPEGFATTPTTVNTDLRGNHSFYLYLSDSFSSDISIKELNWYDGADDITITLSTKNEGRKLCQRTFFDDGNVSTDKQEHTTTIPFECNNLTPGIYLLSFEESSSKKDYVINKLTVNTNKIIVKNGILNLQPLPLYTNVTTEKNIKFYYWHENLDQEITFTSKGKQLSLSLTKEDKGRGVFYPLTAGLWEIYASKGNAVISNADFAFSPEHWFIVEPDYIVTKKIDDSTILLKNIAITVL